MGIVLASGLRAAILQAAMEGRLTEQLPEDGNASDLLEQIKIEISAAEEGKNKKKKERTFEAITEDVPFELPENWIWVKLPDLLSVLPSNGKSVAAVNYDTGIKNLTLTATTSGYFKPEEYKHVNLDQDTAEKFWLYKGDLLIQRSNSRELVGTSCIYDGEDKAYIYPDLIMRMRVIELISARYVDYALKSPHVRTYYTQNASGTSESMPKINQTIVCNTLIPLPPRIEQDRIVARIKEFMLAIDEYEAIEQKLSSLKKMFPEDMRASILQSAMEGKLTQQLTNEFQEFRDADADLVDCDFDYPDSWAIVRIASVCDMYTGNSISESVKKAKYTGLSEGRNYIGTKDVNFDHSITYENGVKIPIDESKFKEAKKGSTLLCIEGGSAGRKIAMLDEDVCFGNKLCSFNPSPEIYNRFLYYVLQSPLFKRTFINNISGIIGGVSIGKLKEVLIPLPPMEEQIRIANRLDALLPLCDELRELS